MTFQQLTYVVEVSKCGSINKAANKLFLSQSGISTAIRELEENTGRIYEKLYIVGGGAKNAFLNRLTEEATGKKVVALPIEATALGNLKIQMEVLPC